jgi:hypothetical protein
MPNITINSIGLGNAIVKKMAVNIRYRKTSDPDIYSSYTDLGQFNLSPNGSLDSPVVISNLDYATNYTVWVTAKCSNSSYTQSFVTPDEPVDPSSPCGTPTSFSGGTTYPAEQLVDLGTNPGTVPFNFNAYSIPDKFQIEWPAGSGNIVVDTGYRGDASEQSALDQSLSDRGLPTEQIVGVGAGTTSFEKTSNERYAKVLVFAPMGGTNWDFLLGCPAVPK